MEEYGFVLALGAPTLEVGHNEVVIDLGALDQRALREMARSLSIEDLKKELGLELEASERLAKEAADYRAKFLDMTARLAEANAKAAEQAQKAQAACR